MKTYKKTLLGLSFLILCILGFFSNLHHASAAAVGDDYWTPCVINIVDPSNPSDKCKLDNSNGIAKMIYGSVEANEDLKTAVYKGSDTTTQVTSNGVTLNTPTYIDILDPSGKQPLFSNDLSKYQSQCGRLSYSGAANTKSVFSDTSTIYEIYRASGTPLKGDPVANCSNFTFLTTINSDGTETLLAVVLDQIQNGNPKFVYAATINKPLQGITQAGFTTPVSKGGACNGGADCVDGQCTKDNGDCTNTQAPTCESNFDSGFEWIICGGLKLADAAAGGFSNFVDDQLCFKTGPTSSTGGVICHGNDNLNDNVKTAWGIFKNIATALLVIVMLVMVISQAIGGGPFDAYTVRKMLPKLVVAVILMQISWVLFKWTIDLSNDLGKGIQNLMYAPFGGADNMQLDKLIGNAAQTHTVGTNNTWAFFTILAGLGGAIANLPGLLTLALFVVVALATAFFVLILRKILIILLIILAPVALIVWILPGTQRYWKMWQDNFTKLLLMFPLIMALIAGGRIFAYIVSGGAQPATGLLPHLAVAHIAGIPVPYFSSVSSFADIAIIVFAYFGPYLLLPKAYTWGGQFMSAAVSQVNDRISKPTMEKGREGVKGIGERYHGRFGKAYDPNAFIGKRVFNRLASGHFMPTPRSQRLAIAAGDKWSQERDEQALAKIKRMGEKVMAEGYKTYVRTDDGDLAKYARDADGNILEDAEGKKIKIKVATEAEAEVDVKRGVAAMKQMWVDLAEDGDSNEAKMAVRQLIATSSWPEIQGSFTRSGKRVIETAAWAPSVTTSPEDYPKVLRSRVDATPHIEDGAKRALEAKLKETPGMSETEQIRFKSQYRIKYAIENQLDNEGFQTQSDGFWQEVARMSDPTDPSLTAEEKARAAEIQASLRKRFEAIRDIGGTAPQQLLGHLKNGGDLQKAVEKALGTSIDTYIPTARR